MPDIQRRRDRIRHRRAVQAVGEDRPMTALARAETTLVAEAVRFAGVRRARLRI
jgi:hypothetical protein